MYNMVRSSYKLLLIYRNLYPAQHMFNVVGYATYLLHCFTFNVLAKSYILHSMTST